MTTFADLGLSAPLCKALEREGYKEPTPIQAQTIGPLLEGRDVLGCAQTGTGKTAAFALPVLQHLATGKNRRGKVPIRALVLTPTRELAAQIGESFTTYGAFLHSRHHVIFGGVNENPQIRALRHGFDILVATPGRLLDLMNRGFVDLGAVDFFILDEADRMLDMGFVHDVRRVIEKLPNKRQNLLFSATMPPSIVKLADFFLVDPIHVEVTPQATTVELIDQTVMFVDRGDKKRLLTSLLKEVGVGRSIVFTRTKHGANRLCQQLDRERIRAAAIHGNKSQGARTRALEGFRRGDIPVLVATDIAARGIDVDNVTHVFNYDLPNIPESYVHRIGRTARAGKSGVAISFCDATEGEYLRNIEKLIGRELEVDDGHKWHSTVAENSVDLPAPKRQQRPPRGGGPRRSGGRGQGTRRSARRGGRDRGNDRSIGSIGSPRGGGGKNSRSGTSRRSGEKSSSRTSSSRSSKKTSER